MKDSEEYTHNLVFFRKWSYHSSEQIATFDEGEIHGRQ